MISILYLVVLMVQIMSIKCTNNNINLLNIAATKDDYLKTGTTIVGITFKLYNNVDNNNNNNNDNDEDINNDGDGDNNENDVVILAADTRSTSGSIVMDKEKHKVHPIGPRIFACAAGTSADCEQLTRNTAHKLALNRIEYSLINNDNNFVMTVKSAQIYLQKLLNSKVNSGTRSPSAVFLVGGIDNIDGASLYHIESTSDTSTIPHLLKYSALGSGSLDAIAVIEAQLQHYRSRNNNKNDINNNENDNNYYLSLDEGIQIARQAVRAGIMNDMGSGSNIDFCVIQKDSVRQWRELSKYNNQKASISNINNNGNGNGSGLDGPRERAKSILASLTSFKSSSSSNNTDEISDKPEINKGNDVRGIVMGEKRIFKFLSSKYGKKGIKEMFPGGVKVEFIDDLIA